MIQTRPITKDRLKNHGLMIKTIKTKKKCPKGKRITLIKYKNWRQIMKKLLVGLLALGSMSSFATSNKEILIKNTTYPDRSMLVQCLSEDCELIRVNILKAEKLSKASILRMSTLRLSAKNRRRDKDCALGENLYKMTREASKDTVRNKKEGYNGKMVLSALGTAGAAILDTAISPFTIIADVYQNCSKVDSVQDKKAAKDLITIIDSDQDLVEKNHKRFQRIQSYIQFGTQGANTEVKFEVIERFYNNTYANCEIRVVGDVNYERYSVLFIDGVGVDIQGIPANGISKQDINELLNVEYSKKCKLN